MNGDSYSSRDGGRQGGSRSYGMRDEHRDRRRRRSRSPRHGSRRDYEVDTYSSSRDYREREREDTYARRERRDERGWGGGDSYSRRDHPRRDDDRGFGRREREGHDERAERPDRVDRGDRGDRFERERGDRGGRGRRGDRGDGPSFGGRDRKKSQSPPFKKREPTPDLTDVVSIQKRQRRMTQWDIKPAGYENITAEQAKLSGMFPLPGAPRAAPMDPSRLAAFMNPAAGSASASALKPENAKQAKRLFVHNLPAGSTSEAIVEFFNLQMNGLNVVSGPDPCISAQISPAQEYALVEFKTPEDATMALTMDGMLMEDDPNNPDKPGLSIRRPKDYIVPVASEADDHMDGVVSSVVKDGPNKLSINHLPPNLDETQLKELLEVFGELKAFVLVQDADVDPNNFQSRGVCFCEYANNDAEVLDQIILGLGDLDLGGKKLLAKRACMGVAQAAALDGGVGAISMLAGSTTDKVPETPRVLMLMNMITHDELLDRDTYEEIKEDVEEECSKFGKILSIKVPRPSGARSNPGVGKIYVKYEDSASTQKAIKALAGRAFSGRTVVATHFSEELFDVDAW